MKSNDIKELRKLSNEELEKELKTAQEALFKLRFQKVVDEMNDLTQIKKNKRKVARIKTLLGQKTLEKK